jgi:hypothetical protein
MQTLPLCESFAQHLKHSLRLQWMPLFTQSEVTLPGTGNVPLDIPGAVKQFLIDERKCTSVSLPNFIDEDAVVRMHGMSDEPCMYSVEICGTESKKDGRAGIRIKMNAIQAKN